MSSQINEVVREDTNTIMLVKGRRNVREKVATAMCVNDVRGEIFEFNATEDEISDNELSEDHITVQKVWFCIVEGNYSKKVHGFLVGLFRIFLDSWDFQECLMCKIL